MTTPDQPSAPLALERERERIITLLSRHFANDGLSLDELETRLELAYKATSLAEVRTLASDLPGLDSGAGPVPVRTAPAPPQLARSRILAVMSSMVRRGVWVPPQSLHLDAVMAEARLDLREAQLAPGVTEIQVRAFWASVKIIVPPGVHVASEVTSVMAEVSDRTDHGTPPPGAPMIRVTGWACMSEVALRTRRPGE